MAPRDAVPLEEKVLDFVRKSEEAESKSGASGLMPLASSCQSRCPLYAI